MSRVNKIEQRSVRMQITTVYDRAILKEQEGIEKTSNHDKMKTHLNCFNLNRSASVLDEYAQT